MVVAISPTIKSLIDMIRLALTLPPWAFPLLAVLLSFLVAVLLFVAASVPLTLPIVALCVLAAIWTAVGAAGITELQNRGNQAIENAKRSRRMGP